MELKEQSVPAGILLKIRKLQALAERGVGGEATNAKNPIVCSLREIWYRGI